MAYNSAIATEAKSKFPSTTHCMTTHALAYRATVKQFNLKVGFFTYKQIDERTSYETKSSVVEYLRAFCLSEFTDFDSYAAANHIHKTVAALVSKYLHLMESGTIECTHDFYLKMFHMLLASGDITYPPFDFIMLDEAGDLNRVTLEIFRLLPSTRKIAVGDPFQNIYQFNHTVNCFELLEGTTFRMSQSFRVSPQIASKIQSFGRRYLDPSFIFVGTPQSGVPSTRAYITRTNAALIAQMIELNTRGVSYGLVRPAAEIFKLPLMLCGLKYQGFITEPAYKHIQADVDEWHESTALQQDFNSPLKYLADIYSEDFVLQQALRLVLRHGKALIMSTYAEAKRHEKSDQSYILCTAHSSKGLEFDEVTIANDLNISLSQTLEEMRERGSSVILDTDRETFNLYYVACTRASHALHNAIHLEPTYDRTYSSEL